MKRVFFFITALCTIAANAQDYLISFAGEGATTIVNTVKVENLNQGTSLTLNGSDILRLKSVITAVPKIKDDLTKTLLIYPNPSEDFSRINFFLTEATETLITVYDFSGRIIIQENRLLQGGYNTCLIQGLEKGIYLVKVCSNNNYYSNILLSKRFQKGNIKLEFENTIAVKEKEEDAKGSIAEIEMQYNAFDRLKFTGIKDNYSTVFVDMPFGNKTITFYFASCTDGDGNQYPIVKVGDQIWMAENLKYLPSVQSNSEFTTASNNSLPGYGVYGYDGNNVAEAKSQINFSTYGVLYNWFGAMAGSGSSNANPSGVQGICPTGWHLPSDAEWTVFANYNLPGEAGPLGGKFKEMGTVHWTSPNTGGTNETGYSALPSGARNSTGVYYSLGTYGYWWSTSENTANDSWFFSLVYNNVAITRNFYNKKVGYAVRCIKD